MRTRISNIANGMRVQEGCWTSGSAAVAGAHRRRRPSFSCARRASTENLQDAPRCIAGLDTVVGWGQDIRPWVESMISSLSIPKSHSHAGHREYDALKRLLIGMRRRSAPRPAQSVPRDRYWARKRSRACSTSGSPFMLVTTLSPVIDHDKASKIAQAMNDDLHAQAGRGAVGRRQRTAARQVVDARKMVGNGFVGA
jgi:hypothetical protein